MAENITKNPPKGKIKFDLTLSEEQKLAKTAILYHPYNFIMGKAGSGKTLLAVQIALDMYFTRQVMFPLSICLLGLDIELDLCNL